MPFRREIFLVVLVVGSVVARPCAAQKPQQTPAETGAIASGVAFLRGHSSMGKAGEAAMMALALLKADVPPTDPSLAALLAKVRERVSGSAYSPERSGGVETYEAAAILMVLTNLDAEANRQEITALAQFLMSQQNANGSWDYKSRPTAGDTSISQYGVLGLWEAEGAGVNIPPSVWDRAASWFLSVQASGGSWNYHRDENGPETLSMTAAGIGSLLICERELARYRKGGTESVSSLLVPLVAAGQVTNYKPTTSAAALADAIKRGISWLARNFVLGPGPLVGRSPYYGLYGIERIGALSDSETIGGIDWFRKGSAFILGSQQAGGHWASTEMGAEVATAWSVLFLTKATKKTIDRVRVKRLGAGTLLGGRGLPKDLSSLTVAQGRVVVRPMNGAIEGMLAILEDPRAENGDSALAGLVTQYQERGSAALRPFKDRLRALLADRDAGVRRVGVWGLGRTGDLDVVPLLIATLRDQREDETVVNEARISLKLLSRKIDGYGPPPGSPPEKRAEAAKAWQGWYDAIRPIGSDASDVSPTAAAGR